LERLNYRILHLSPQVFEELSLDEISSDFSEKYAKKMEQEK
jgi:hypothetical protein